MNHYHFEHLLLLFVELLGRSDFLNQLLHNHVVVIIGVGWSHFKVEV